MSDDLVMRAARFAYDAHKGQQRKYTGDPYFVHAEEVAAIVSLDPSSTQEMIAAAYLHDTVEDTPVSIEDIETAFGEAVARLVAEVTDISRPEMGNRATRKAIDRDHLARASPEGKTIKLADIISNTTSVVERDPKFAVVYLREKRDLLPHLRDATSPGLFKRAEQIIAPTPPLKGDAHQLKDTPNE